MKRNAFLLVLFAGVIALAAWQFASSGVSDGATTTATAIPASAPAIVPSSDVGYVAHFDENGQLVEEPVTGSDALHAYLSQSINTSSEGLVQVASPAPGGGVMIDLQGRFQSTAAAKVDANGKLDAPCLTNEADVDAFTSTTAAGGAAAKE